MRILSKTCSVFAWIIAIFLGTLIQGLCLYVFWQARGGNGLTPFLLTACAMLLLWTGILLYTIPRKTKFPGLWLVTAAGVVFLVNAFVLRQAMIPYGILTVKPDGEVAMDSWKILWRHSSPVLVPILLWLSELFSRLNKDRRELAEILHEIEQDQEALSTLSLHAPEDDAKDR